jgi:coenzyme F420-reducing hydrogenase beta subunit
VIKLFEEKKDCSGCGACLAVCPQKAITMTPDAEGFVFPVIDNNLCVECGLCVRTCAFQNVPVTADEPLATYAAVNKDQTALHSSSSGGVFAALASLTFEGGGVVFGCAFNSDMEPEHVCIDSPADMKRLQGSKYVQSDVKNTYAEAQKYLREGRRVLYTGTPCQIAGLKSYLGQDYDCLITADVICYGVPSAAFFKGYMEHLEDKLKGRVVDFKFRDKSKGWGSMGKVVYDRNGVLRERLITPLTSYYITYFYSRSILRESCYNCKYAGGNRQGDFTMGDYWGIEKAHPEIDARNGVSVLLVNSEKGRALVPKLSKLLSLTESTFDQAKAQNCQLNRPTPKSNQREAILTTWREGGYRAVADEYWNANRQRILITRVKMVVPQPVKRLIKRIVRRQ